MLADVAAKPSSASARAVAFRERSHGDLRQLGRGTRRLARV